MKNRKGFTLVELPAVLRMYRQSRVSNFQYEVRSVYRTAQSQFVSDSMSLNAGGMIAYTNAAEGVTGVNTIKELEMTGNSNFKYYVLMNVDGKVLNIRATNGTYSYSLKAKNNNRSIKIEDIDVEVNNEEMLDSNIMNSVSPESEQNYEPHISTFVSRKYEDAITKGDELTIVGENFFVVSSNELETVLLAKYDLNNSSILQDASGSNTTIKKLAFSDIGYWDECQYSNSSKECTNNLSGLLSKYSVNGLSYCDKASSKNCTYVYDENSNLKAYVDAYAKLIDNLSGVDVKDRLMTL